VKVALGLFTTYCSRRLAWIIRLFDFVQKRKVNMIRQNCFG